MINVGTMWDFSWDLYQARALVIGFCFIFPPILFNGWYKTVSAEQQGKLYNLKSLHWSGHCLRYPRPLSISSKRLTLSLHSSQPLSRLLAYGSQLLSALLLFGDHSFDHLRIIPFHSCNFLSSSGHQEGQHWVYPSCFRSHPWR